jgi:hypothetical protein
MPATISYLFRGTVVSVSVNPESDSWAEKPFAFRTTADTLKDALVACHDRYNHAKERDGHQIQVNVTAIQEEILCDDSTEALQAIKRLPEDHPHHISIVSDIHPSTVRQLTHYS